MAGIFSDKVKKATYKDGEIDQLAVENDFLSQGLKIGYFARVNSLR
jgi:hypothetical protein